MNMILKTTLAVAALIGTGFAAHADETVTPYSNSAELRQSAELAGLSGFMPRLTSDTTIAVARLDGGRLIPTPYSEAEDWAFLDRRVDANIVQLGASTYIKYVPELPLGGLEATSKIDEVRLASANEGFEYVLIYGLGLDADWASFGGVKLQDTGLSVKPDCAAWEAAKAKALLVNSFTGEVLGAATADNIEFNIGELADEVEDMIYNLTPISQTAELVVTIDNIGG